MKNFIVVGTQRTGSSALAEWIGTHPSVACGWEWTLRAKYTKKVSTAKHALKGDFSVLNAKNRDYINSQLTPNTEWLGYRQLFRSSNKWLINPRFSPTLFIDRLYDFTRWLSREPNLHIIHIIRKDNLAWLASKSISSYTGKFTGAYNFEDRVVVDLSEGIKRLRAKTWVDKALSQLEKTNPYHRVYYEDFKLDNGFEGNKALNFLGCDTCNPNNGLRKLQVQSSKSLCESIENYSQVVEELTRNDLLTSAI